MTELQSMPPMRRAGRTKQEARSLFVGENASGRARGQATGSNSGLRLLDGPQHSSLHRFVGLLDGGRVRGSPRTYSSAG